MNSTGQATSFIPVYFNNINGWRVVATADLNHDGIMDIVLQESSSTLVGGWIMNSSGQPISFVPVYFASTGSWRVVGSEDLNNDGILDLLLQDTISTFVAVWIMNSAGQPTSFDDVLPCPTSGPGRSKAGGSAAYGWRLTTTREGERSTISSSAGLAPRVRRAWPASCHVVARSTGRSSGPGAKIVADPSSWNSSQPRGFLDSGTCSSSGR